MSSFTESNSNPIYGVQQYENAWFSEHRDLQATAMSVDWSGSWVLLAGRRHLALQSLDKDENDESLRKFHRNSKYEVSSAEWAICENSQEYCAIATSQLIEVVTWSRGDPTLIHSLRAHTRVVTDIDWHSKTPHLLASCSVDTFTHLWDLRDPRKPILSLSAVCMSGATQVGFNRVSGNLIATAHDGDLRIWDQRKGSCPVQYITAHLARIHGINWSHEKETHLATASQDGTVKYFDINNPRRAEKIITTPSPVWRARYTPFADGLVTIIVPHLGLGRGENSLLLWNNSKQNAPICSFVGHSDVVLDFAWRPNRNSNNPDMELITWSRDQTLRVWRVDEELQRLCGKEESELDDDGLLMEELPIHKLHLSEGKVSDNKSQPNCALQHEFSLLNTNIPHIDIEVLDPKLRSATVRISANGYVIMLQITFPYNYPKPNVPPEFTYCQGTSLDNNLAESLMKVLKNTANQRVKKDRTCLEQCLREMVTALKKATSGADKGHLGLQSPRLEGALSGALHDACVPFPKTSGARFNNVGILVTFSRPLNTKRISLRHHNTTPRALSALSGGYLGNVMGSQPVLYAHRDPKTSAFYLPDRKSSRNRKTSQKICPSTVNIYDITKTLLINKELAENYIINPKNIPEMCHQNKEVAEKYGRPDIVQCWTIAKMIAQSNTELDPDDDLILAHNPFAKNILESLIKHFARIHDIQTAVMLCITFGRQCPTYDLTRSSTSSNKSTNHSPSGSPYHTVLPLDTTSNPAWHLATQLKQLRSNSWSESLDDCKIADFSDLSKSILGDSNRVLYDNFKRVYADILYRWCLPTQRDKILEYVSTAMDILSQGIEFPSECSVCRKNPKDTSCNNH